MDERLSKIVLSLSFLLIAVSAITLSQHPAPGFLPSIYSGVPLAVYGFMTLSFGFFTVVAIFTRNRRISVAAFIGASLPPLLFVFLPYIRTGLAYDRADVLAHIGIVRNLLSTGVLNTRSVSYPAQHLLAAFIIAPSGIDEGLAFTIILATLSLIFAITTMVFTNALYDRITLAVGAGLIAYLPILGGYNSALVPNGVSLFLVPPTLFAVFKCVQDYRSRWLWTTLVLVSATTVAHPLVPFLLLHVFGTIVILLSVQRHFDPDVARLTSGKVHEKVFVGISLAIGAWYILSTTIWQGFILRLSSVFTSIERSASGTRDVGGRLSVLDLSGIIELFVLQYGARALVALATIGGFILVIQRANRRNWYLFAPAGLWLLFNGIYLIISLAAPAATFPPLRFADMIYATAPLFAIIVGANWVRNLDANWRSVAAVMMITITLFSFSAVGLYQGQHTTGHNSQQTQVEMESANWVIDYKADKVAIIGFSGPRYEQSILGFVEVRERREDFPRSFDPYGRLPLNLRTDDGVFITNALEDRRYIRITKEDYVNGIQDQLQREDEEELANRTYKVYDAGEYRLYYTTHTNRDNSTIQSEMSPPPNSQLAP